MKTLCTKRLVASTLAVLMSLSSISCAAGLRKESTTTSEQGATVEPPLETEKKPTNRPSNQPDPDPETEILPEIPETDTDSVLLPETDPETEIEIAPETEIEIETQIPPASQPEDETETSVTAEPETEKHRHAYGKWVVSQKNTCTEDGRQYRSCACGETETKTVPATGHSYTRGDTISPTATEDGYTKYTCTECRDSYTEAIVPIAFEVTSANRHMVGYTGASYEELVIPAVFRDGGTWYRVTNIGVDAFSNCTELTSVTIPDSVVRIRTSAFTACRNMTSVTLPSSVTSIDQGAFLGCSSLTSVVIPNGIMSIDYLVFGDCYNLNSVVIPDSVTRIDASAFTYCSNLTAVYYTGTEAQWNSIFKGTNWDYSIGSNLGGYTVHYDYRPPVDVYAPAAGIVAHSIDSFFVNDSLYFGYDGQADANLNSINNTIIFAAGEAHNSMALRGWIGFTQPIDHFGYQVNDSQMVWGDFTEATEEIILQIAGEHATRYRIQVPLADLGAGTHTVGFYIKLQDGTVVHLRENLTVIIEPPAESEPETEPGASYSEGLEYTLLGDGTYGVSGIGSCTDVELVIPVTYEGKAVTSICGSAFSYCGNLISVTIPDGVTSIGSHAFYECYGLTSVTIPDSVMSIGDVAFSGCSSLASVTIPDSVTSIGIQVFMGCQGLTSVTIGDGVMSIGEGAFNRCNSLTSVTIPDDVTSIGEFAFYLCGSLTLVTIPDSVTSIGEWAFRDCSTLTDIYYTGTEAQWNAISKGADWDTDAGSIYGGYTVSFNYDPNHTHAFGQWKYSAYPSCTDYGERYRSCACGATETEIVSAYGHSYSQGATVPPTATEDGYTEYWCSVCGYGYADAMIPVDFEITADNRHMVGFTGDPGEELVIPAVFQNGDTWYRVTRIGKGAFYGSNLIAVTIPDSVTVIGDYAFSYCGALGFVAVPESVTVIGEWAFYSCGLSAFSIPSGVTDIAPYTFYACISLTSISIPDGVTSIGESAFLNCINLTSIDYMGSESQWSAISKGIDWDTDAGINYGGYTVHYGYAPSVENLAIPQEQWVVSGHVPSIVTTDHNQYIYSGMLDAAGVKSAALLHQGSIGLGKIDLSLYSKVVVYWGTDASDVTINAYNANANNRFMLVTTDKNGLMSPDESTVIAATTYRLHGWHLKAVEIDLTGVDYSGPVFLTNDSLPGNLTLVYSIEFVV